MAEVIDMLLICWCILALGVYSIGLLFEKQLKQQQSSKKSVSGAAATTNLDDFWSTPPTRNRNYDQQAYNHEFSYGGANSSDYQQQRQYFEPATSCGHQSTVEASRRTSGLLATSLYSSASVGEEYRQQRQQQQLQAIPTATGFSGEAVEWVNSILYLFYTQPEKYGPVIAENVYRSLNEKLSNITSSSGEHANLMLEIEGLNSELSSRPELTNLRTECESDKSISASCKIYNKRLTFTLLIRRLLGREHAGSSVLTSAAGLDQEARYELTLENLEGKLKSMAILGDKLIVIQFIEKPDTKILLRPLDAYAQRQQLISEDVLVQMVLQTLTQVVVDLYFGADPDFPQYKSTQQQQQQQQQSKYSNYKHKINNILRGSASELKRSLKGDIFHNDGGATPRERRVFVKIIRAKNINYNQNVTCLMELDAPKQQAVSSTKPGNSNPFWDEHFLFGLSEKSQALTLELWDSLNPGALGEVQRGVEGTNANANASPASSTLNRWQTPAPRWSGAELTATGAKFLGLARVSLAELRANPVQRLNLTLQPALGAPLNDLSNSVGGELQLELLLLEHSVGSPLSSQAELNKSASELAYQQGDLVSIDRKLTRSGYVITTTTITKQQQQLLADKHDTLLVRPQSAVGSSSVATTERSFEGILQMEDSHSVDGLENNSRQADSRSEGRVSRSRNRSRSFLRAIKKRFSFSRTRSRSIGAFDRRSSCSATGDGAPPGTSDGDHQLEFEMAGARSRTSSEVSAASPGGRARSVPAQRNADATGELPTIVINKGGRLSDGAASAFTFTHPKSQLVIEVFEPTLRADGAGNNKTRGIYRHYALSEAEAQKRKWRKRGTKLHLFNEHQFIACHLASSSTCHLCGRVFSRRPGKQGYKCRNCHLLLHKQCHVKVDHNCPYAARDALQLEYIDAEPHASLVDELNLSSQRPSPSPPTRQQQQQLAMSAVARAADPYGRPRGPGLRSAPKSISMEVDDR